MQLYGETFTFFADMVLVENQDLSKSYKSFIKHILKSKCIKLIRYENLLVNAIIVRNVERFHNIQNHLLCYFLNIIN